MGCGSSQCQSNENPVEEQPKKRKLVLKNINTLYKDDGLEKAEGGNMENLNKNFSKGNNENPLNLNDHKSIFEYKENDPNQILNFAEEIVHFGKDIHDIEVCFLIDTTASMANYTPGIIKTVQQIIKDGFNYLKKLKLNDSSFKVSYVQYRDHEIDKFLKDFTTKVSDFDTYVNGYQYIEKVVYAGGADECEAVIDGLSDVANTVKWGDKTAKFVFHFLDSPPHGKNYSKLKDAFPQGCPCKLDVSVIFEKLKKMNIVYTIIELSDDRINKMVNEFSKLIDVSVCKIATVEGQAAIVQDQYK